MDSQHTTFKLQLHYGEAMVTCLQTKKYQYSQRIQVIHGTPAHGIKTSGGHSVPGMSNTIGAQVGQPLLALLGTSITANDSTQLVRPSPVLQRNHHSRRDKRSMEYNIVFLQKKRIAIGKIKLKIPQKICYNMATIV
jgi:hypothetical protein